MHITRKLMSIRRIPFHRSLNSRATSRDYTTGSETKNKILLSYEEGRDTIIFTTTIRHCWESLTPWTRAILEHLTVPQPLKYSPHVMEPFKIYYHVHKGPLFVPILSQTSPAHVLPSYFFKVGVEYHYSHLRLGILSGLLTSSFPIKILYASSFCCILCKVKLKADTRLWVRILPRTILFYVGLI